MYTFVPLALALLVMTLLWHIPLMLWDHLDLVPIYRAWQDGHLSDSDFWRIHGGHVHTTAYAVLLATTWLSGGQTWLDSLTSWLLLIAYAGVIFRFIRTAGPDAAQQPRIWLAAVALLCLYPGHLANLQWGWQVAVFLCLIGTVTSIALLTGRRLTWWHNLLALLMAAVAVTSFASGIALLPTALVLIALRASPCAARRMLFVLPWLVATAWVGWQALHVAEQANAVSGSLLVIAHYALNLVGGGIARFATDLAPWLALLAIGSLAPVLWWLRGDARRLPWLGLVLFSLLCAGIIAGARAAPFGTEHAFVTRYVSFSSLFWLGWLGLVGLCFERVGNRRRLLVIASAVLLALAVANAVHMIGKAKRLSRHAQVIAQTLRADFPSVDRALLGEIYFEQPDVALERLRGLRELRFAPFD